MKVIDVDALFDKYISDFVYGNIGKIKPDEIENKIPELYEEFGDAPQKELDGKTPSEYYRGAGAEELFSTLKAHLDSKVPVSDFLCEAINDCDGAEEFAVKELMKENGEEYTLYLMNILNDMNSDRAAERYLEFILLDYGEPVRELATELLCSFPEKVKDAVLKNFDDADDTKKGCLTQILSYCGRDEGVFEILKKEFIRNKDNVPLYAGYLAKYGDERVLPLLYEAIDNQSLNYLDFKEIKFAIESLGGEYNKQRDFTHDKIYQKIKGVKPKH